MKYRLGFLNSIYKKDEIKKRFLYHITLFPIYLILSQGVKVCPSASLFEQINVTGQWNEILYLDM